MGKLAQTPNVSNLTAWEKLRDYCSILFDGLTNLVQGNLSFADNFKCKIISVSFSAADTETTVAHNLGFIPSGYLVINASCATHIYDGSTSWTVNNIYLKASSICDVDIMFF